MCSSSSRRRRTRKPKFLSLRRHLAPPPPPPPAPHMDDGSGDPHVACLLELDDAGASCLAALLGPASVASSSSTSSAAAGSPESPRSTSVSWEGLARRALRGRERMMIFCRSASPAPPPSPEAEEVTSSGGGWVGVWGGGSAPRPLLSLKLDYEEILAAWSDRGPLYIGGGGAAQVVPQLHHNHSHADLEDHTAAVPSATVFVEVGGGWSVPEMEGVVIEETSDNNKKSSSSSNSISREERVMRYKEKRRSRLFAKRIRYEVRKLNADKRPRIKGRFVKRADDEQ